MADGTSTPGPSRIETVRFVADGGIPPELAAEIVALVSRRLRVPCRLDPSPWVVEPTHLNGREQVDADLLLAGLERTAAPGTIRVGLTGLDIGLPIFAYVFGRATRGGRAAVVSLARLSPVHYGLPADADRFMRRAVTEILHEIGHVVGLGHCDDFGCVMRFAPSVDAIDVRGGGFCAACAQALPKDLLSSVPA